VSGGTVAKFVTTISILLLLTIILISNILVITNDVSINSESTTNTDALEYLSKFSSLIGNGTEDF